MRGIRVSAFGMMLGLVWVAVRVALIAWSVSKPGLRFALSELRAFRHSRDNGNPGEGGPAGPPLREKPGCPRARA